MGSNNPRGRDEAQTPAHCQSKGLLLNCVLISLPLQVEGRFPLLSFLNISDRARCQVMLSLDESGWAQAPGCLCFLFLLDVEIGRREKHTKKFEGMLDGLKPRPRSVTPSLCALPRHFTTRIKFVLCNHSPELTTVTPTALVPASLHSCGRCIFSAGGHSSSGRTMAQASPSRLLSKLTLPARGVDGGNNCSHGLLCPPL